MANKNEKVTIRRAMSVHIRALKELYRISPRFFHASTLSALFSATFPYVTVFFSARILAELATLRRTEVLWKWVVIGVLCTGILGILKAILEQRKYTLDRDLILRKDHLFTEKMFSMDYADMDKQQTHDLRTQIRQNENWAGFGLEKVQEFYSKFLQNSIGILSGIALTVELFTSPVPASAGAFTLLNHPIFVVVLAALMILISLLAGNLAVKAQAYWGQQSEEATLGNRFYDHFGFTGFTRNRRVDMRMYHQQRLIDTYWGNATAFNTSGSFAKLAKGRMGLCSGFSVGVTALLTGCIYVFTCLKAWCGAFDVGSVTQYIGAATALANNVYTLTALIGEIKTNTTYLEQTIEFLDIPNSMYQGSLTTEKRSDRQYEVEFKDVSFRYPGTNHWALRHVSMKFKVGKRLAIVGENGSGKTTFIKLLCRLYDPQEGEILLNGINIRKYNYRDYMGIFSVVFQDFQLLSQPLGANVAGETDYDQEKVRKALIDAGFGDRLNSMPNGLDTLLYKDFGEDGVEVSGGEAQKIAIARALYKDAPFIILDEPTAALDPIAEAEIYAKFNDISGDKTAIYISHRLSSCKFCDEIAVFHDGSVIQQGSHEALLSDKNGMYHALWTAQAQYYTES